MYESVLQGALAQRDAFFVSGRNCERTPPELSAVHRFAGWLRQPRALPRDLVDHPPCTFVDRKRKRQLRGCRYYIHGS